MPERLRQGGRRWRPVMYLLTEPAQDGFDRILNPPWNRDIGLLTYDRDYEYRMVFEPESAKWRLDMRRHIEGG